jgi:spore coat protein U-like protein
MMISCAPIESLLPQRLLRAALVLLALLAASALVPQDAARANNVVCLMNSAALNMGTANTGVGTIDFTCTNWSRGNRTFDLCIGLGNPSWPGTPQQPVLRGPNDARLNFNVFRDAAFSAVWTQAQPLAQRVSMTGGLGNTFSGTFRFYAAVAPGQSPRPGIYQAAFFNMIIGFMNSAGACNTTGNPNLSGQQFTLPITRSVSNDCSVSALGDADLGTAPAGRGAVTGSTTISVRCPTGTAFNIGLRPSNDNSNGAGVLQGSTGTGAGAATLAYQLRQGSASGPVWGNTASASGPGNGVGGTGNGMEQTFPVFVSVPQTNVTPGTYRDTVIVTVHF